MQTTTVVVLVLALVVLAMAVGGLLFAGGPIDSDGGTDEPDPNLPDTNDSVDPDWIQSQDRKGGGDEK